MEGRQIAFPRGKAHGGSSAINAMTFIRGDRRCFDRWRDLGNTGWGYDDVLPLFMRLEKNETGASEYRGGDGPLAVSGCYDPHAAHRAFLTAAIPPDTRPTRASMHFCESAEVLCCSRGFS